MGCGSSTRNLGFLGDRALLSFSTNYNISTNTFAELSVINI